METKQFKLVDGQLKVTAFKEDIVYLPSQDGKQQEEVGKYEQETVQIIRKDKIQALLNFVKNEKLRATKQLDDLNKQYEQIKDLQDIDEKLLIHMKKSIDKGSKAFKSDMVKLNQRIMDLDRKKGLKAQIAFIDGQMKKVNDDLKQLEETIK